ncbi:MAG: DNA repair protein RecN [Acidimicrobiales bacterium]
MLVELAVRDLGVIEQVCLRLGPGMTALTGETGAGKTLVVEALGLLVGGHADPILVRPGATEALVEGRFETGEAEADEVLLARSVPAVGRSRGWLNSRMAPISTLAEVGSQLVELHGQHAHQSLLSQAAQRASLDSFAGLSLDERAAARAALQRVDAELASMGGDARTRARQVDLLAFQIDELDRAGLDDPAEDADLALEEDRLARATAHRSAAQTCLAYLVGEGTGSLADGASGALGVAISAVTGHPPLKEATERLRGIQSELGDTAGELRLLVEALEDDPARLEQVRARRQMLMQLRRKYGETLEEVITYAADARRQLGELETHETTVAALESRRFQLINGLQAAEAALGGARRAGAADFAVRVETHLHALAMPRARFEVLVGEGAGDEVTFGLGANPGEPVLPLAKVASGGELARTMLAVRLALGNWNGAGSVTGQGARDAEPERQPTLVFDEVDAGVGGQAALAVGRALATLARSHQVLVVTHLAQVAAFADQQVVVDKVMRGGRAVAELRVLEGEGRVVEVSRMLSGQPDSATARAHAAELLGLAASGRNEL